MDDMTALVEQAQRGEPKALEKLLSAIAPAIHRFGLRMCRSEHDADDVLQEALLLVATKLGEFEGRSSLPSWAFALTRSACARKRRGLKNQPPVDDTVLQHQAGGEPTPEQVAVERELGHALREALDRLPDDYREVILLRDVEGLTASEVASALDTSVDAVKSRLHRARSALRQELRPVLESPSLVPAPGCPDVVLMLSRKLEGELTQQDCASMEHHLEACPRCTAVCDAVRSALAACRRSAVERVRPDVQARVQAAIQTCLLNRGG
jgi:RNA polymerase sigma-70 factor, ECF subfamily